jgi:hypothetical protein
MLTRERVKAPVLIPFGLVLLLVVGALLATAYWYEDRARRQDLAAGRLAAQYMLAAEIESHAETLQAALLLLGLDGSLRAAFASGDRERLLAVVAPLFGQMRDRLGVSHFYLVRHVAFRGSAGASARPPWRCDRAGEHAAGAADRARRPTASRSGASGT